MEALPDHLRVHVVRAVPALCSALPRCTPLNAHQIDEVGACSQLTFPSNGPSNAIKCPSNRLARPFQKPTHNTKKLKLLFGSVTKRKGREAANERPFYGALVDDFSFLCVPEHDISGLKVQRLGT